MLTGVTLSTLSFAEPLYLWLLPLPAILLVLWLLGFSFHVGGSLIHILLVLAVIALLFNLITGRRTVV